MATVTISLPKQIAQKIDYESQKQGFSTRSEFIRNIIRDHFAAKGDAVFETFEPRPLNEIKLELAKTGKYSQESIESLTKGLAQSSKYEH